MANDAGTPSLPKSNALEGVKDWGRVGASPAYCDEDYAGHRFEHSEFIGIKPPERNARHRGGKSKKNGHHHHKDKHARSSGKPSPHAPPSTPPSERVQFLLGLDATDEEDESRRAHDVFCEMSELTCKDDDPDSWTWKEIARWVKFEEDVEEGGERWSKPFVATLSLYSLFEVRKCMLSGSILLDSDASNLQQVADLIIENMVNSRQLKPDDRDRVRDILLRRHRHQHEKKPKTREGSSKGLPLIRSLAEIGKKKSEPSSVVNSSKGALYARRMSVPATGLAAGLTERKASVPADLINVIARNYSNAQLPNNDSCAEFDPNDSCPDFKVNLAFMKKIPPGAEAANILIGEVDFLENMAVGFIRLSKAIMMGDFTEVPVPTRFIFMLLGPKTEFSKKKYHEIGRSVATLMSDEVYHNVAYKARNKLDLLAGVDEFLSNCTVLPPGEWDPSIRIEPPKSVPSQEGRKEGALPNGTTVSQKKADDEEDHTDSSLVRTGRLFGGLMDDVKRKAPFYLSDLRDSLHIQCLASFVYLYFACLTPIITFGGLLGDATKNNMAAMESILAGAICGIIYALFSGQPLTILGSTGPVLVFETITYHFCEDNHLDYLSFRWWIGIWVMILLTIMVAFDLSALVRYITRFTEESFAALISLIFIKEAFAKLFDIAHTHPFNKHPDWVVDCACQAKNQSENGTSMTSLYDESSFWNVTDSETCLGMEGQLVGADCLYHDSIFFFSIVLFFGTFTISWALKGTKTGRFFPTMVRSLISDFAVIIAIVAMLGLDLLVGLATPKLNVPMQFKPTRDDRGWIISPFGNNPWWTCLGAIVPALLAVILIFMDQQITAVIVNRKENKLKKGAGYHLDLLIVALLIGVCSVLGLPWFVAATVLSITHVMSLKKESESAAPGERPQFLGVREQRVTGIAIFTVIGLSVLFTFVLKNIPMPILYGVFLYMGISSLKGVQLVNRILIIFMPAKYQPDYTYLRHVPLKRVHLFTAIQFMCLAILWVIKTIKAVSIVFPLMVLAMCFVRKAMDYMFSQHELSWLDDIMPESKKREEEDEEMKVKLKNEDICTTLAEGGGNVEIPLSDGNVMSIPVEKITYQPETATINISEEMAETAIWRQIAANADKDTHQEDRKRKKHRSKKRDGESSKSSSNGARDLRNKYAASRCQTSPIPEEALHDEEEEEEEDDEDEEEAGIVLNLDKKKRGADEAVKTDESEVLIDPLRANETNPV